MEIKLVIKQWFANKNKWPRILKATVIRETAKALYIQGHAEIDTNIGCCICGRDLTHPVSRVVGIGPECGKHYHINIATGDSTLTTSQQEYLESLIRDIKVEGWVPKTAIQHGQEQGGTVVRLQEGQAPVAVVLEDATATEPAPDAVLQDGKIYARCKYAENIAIKEIPGRKWNPQWKCWEFPASGRVAVPLVELLGRGRCSADVLALADGHGAALATAAAAKVADDLAQPPLTKTPAWKHQCQAFWFLRQLQAGALFMEMGTGKSKVTVDLIVNSGAHRSIIVCPKAVIPVWPKQFDLHGGSPVEVICLNDYTTKNKVAVVKRWLEHGGPVAFVVNYESIWREPLAEFLLKQNWDYVVCDESHKIKSPGSRVSKFMATLGRRAKHRLCLTGTPMANSPLDVYGQYRFLDPTVFGTSFKSFQNKYAVMGGYGGYQVFGYKNQEEMAAKMYEIAFRVRSADVLDLPPVTHVNRYCELSYEATKVYRQLKKDMIAEFADGEITTDLAITKILRLQQITGGALPLDDGRVETIDSSKAELLAEVLDDISPDEPVVVFARFRHDIDAIRAVATESGRRVAELSGQRNDLATWDSGGCDVIVVQIKSGGAGIDLTRARYCVYYSVGHSLGDYDQSLARTHRPGQTRPVTYVHLLVSGTIDIDIQRALDEKADVVSYMIDVLKG